MELDLRGRFSNAYKDYMNSWREHQNATAQMDQLKLHLQAAGTLSKTAEGHLLEAEKALVRQQKSLDGLLFCIPLEVRTSRAAQSVIDRVFETAELLEIILHFLRLHDALAAQQVSRAFYRAIQDSPRIQRGLGFLPDYDAALRVPVPLTTPNVYFYIDDFSDSLLPTDDNSVSLNGDIFNGVDRLPRLGPKSRQILVCQPPVKALSMSADCCHDRFPFPHAGGDQEPTHVIRSEQGVTLGDVIDAAHQITKKHRTCPNAPMSMHDEHGMVRPSLYLSAKVMLKEDDPRLARKRQRREQEVAISNRRSGLGTRIGPYIAAKQSAQSNGQPIPTLEEFERSQLVQG